MTLKKDEILATKHIYSRLRESQPCFFCSTLTVTSIVITVSPQSRIVSSRAENIYLAPEKIGYKKVNPVIWQGVSKADVQLLRATRGACNPNLQAVIRHASHVCSQHSFGLPLRMYGMHRTHFDHAYLDLVSLVIWTFVFWPSVTWNLRKEQRYSKSVLTFDRCHLHSVTFGYY